MKDEQVQDELQLVRRGAVGRVELPSKLEQAEAKRHREEMHFLLLMPKQQHRK